MCFRTHGDEVIHDRVSSDSARDICQECQSRTDAPHVCSCFKVAGLKNHLSATLELGLVELSPSDRWEELFSDQRNPALLALAHTAPLTGLSLVVTEQRNLPTGVASFFEQAEMMLRHL